MQLVKCLEMYKKKLLRRTNWKPIPIKNLPNCDYRSNRVHGHSSMILTPIVVFTNSNHYNMEILYHKYTSRTFVEKTASRIMITMADHRFHSLLKYLNEKKKYKTAITFGSLVSYRVVVIFLLLL